MSSKTQFSEKSPSPQPFTEPKNMTTVELNKSGYHSEDSQNVTQTEVKKFKVGRIMKMLVMAVGLFIVLGVCITILILLIKKGNTTTSYRHNSTASLQIMLNDKEKVKTCKTSKTLEDCCYIFFKNDIHNEVGKCTVQKVLHLFLQYEMEANKRTKRQSYDNVGADYRNDYFFDYNYWENEPNVDYPQYNENYFDYYNNVDPSYYQNGDQILSQQQPEPPINDKKCQDDHCPNVIDVSTKIRNITNVTAEPGKLKISLNDTKINIKPELRASERISQGNDFEMKPTGEVKQPNPCIYPLSAPYVSAYPSFDPSSIYGMMPVPRNIQHQPLYVINPPIYSMPFQGYNHYQSSPFVNKNPIQVAGTGGQFYVCNPISSPMSTSSGVEVRRMSEGFTLQDMVQSTQKVPSNKTREAIECPIGTRACTDGSKCIHNKHLCDNEVNCNDASDETGCSCKNRIGEFRWCDGYPDCPDGEDERNCFDCDSDEFSCDDWSRFQRGTCVPLDQRCDGVKQCEITGKDEEDCSILTDHLGQHSLSKVSNAVGFLHRNYKGKWYPTCFGAEIFSSEVCKTEAGPNEMAPKTHLVQTNDNYPGQFVDVTPMEGVVLADTCMRNQAAFVECPPIYCGLRFTITNPFRTSEIDTSVEEFLTRRRRIRKEVGDSRVVGGKPSQPTAWPWVVSIYKNGVFHCGGVLITDLWVLTAAHCVDKFWFFYYEIQAGILRRFSYSPMEQTRFATVAIPNENYNRKSLKNDIALMKLSKPVRFNRYVRPLCLPSEATAGEDFLRGPKPNTICVTVGWGATVEHGADPDHLREVEVPILPQCKHTEDKEGDEICAGLLEGGRDACQGDSGGPLMCQSVRNRSQWYLAGIVSHGEGCARPNEPGVYTKVSKYIGWIQENINGKTAGKFPLQKCPGYVCLETRRCIPKKRHCDKIVDCLFGDDEVSCWQSPDTTHSEIVGRPNNFLGHLLHIFDLDDSSEENDSEFSGEVESNETDTSPEKFYCENMFQAISFSEKCNKVVDCEDGTDESKCSCIDYLSRVDTKAICNGVTDCKDLSDEANCTKCVSDEYLCRISQKCVPLQSRCDRKPDCIHAEDEWDCVALTDGETLVLDSDLRPRQSMKGIITINRFGVWRPLCTNASVDNVASIATNVCNLLGFEEYTAFHKLEVEDREMNAFIEGFEGEHSSLKEIPRCDGLFVRCLNVSLGKDIRKIGSQLEFYTTPWNAIVYLEGEAKCTATIWNSRCVITSRACFPKNFENNSYIAALLGKGKAHLDVEGPHEQVVLVESIAVINNTLIVLCASQNFFFNRYIQPVHSAVKFHKYKEQCVATGIDAKKTKVVVLKSQQKCPPGFRCFKMKEKNCKVISEPWNGIITCNSRDGWYPVAVFRNITDLCDFSRREFATIDSFTVDLAIGNNLTEVSPEKCDGFRCTLGQCLKNIKVCDGIPDCRNGADEDSNLCSQLQQHCHLSGNCTDFSPCKLSEFKCRSGICVPKTSFCDTIDDCKDSYDEPDECSCRTYLETVHPEKICDGTVNCWDRSDENPEKCSCNIQTNVTCGQTDLCVSQEMVCDGFKDCPNGEDESRCYTLKTKRESINSGEVMKCTAGVWHSGCFSRNHTRSALEEICERLGFAGGSARQLMPSKDANNTAVNPVKDRFDSVWIRREAGSGLKLRFRTGNEPYVKFVEDPNCYKLFIECL